jgi:hypothetical protein
LNKRKVFRAMGVRVNEPIRYLRKVSLPEDASYFLDPAATDWNCAIPPGRRECKAKFRGDHSFLKFVITSSMPVPELDGDGRVYARWLEQLTRPKI